METSTIALVTTGLMVGAVSGVLGIGGAVVLVPTLVLVFGFSQGRAQGTSIGALVPPIGLFAALQYYRSGLLDVRAAALIACGFVLGAFGGASVVPYVPQAWLRRGFATLLAYVAVELALSEPGKRSSPVLPGVVAAAAMWLLVALRRRFRRAPPASDDDIEYHI